MKGTILIVDDERKITEVLAAYLTRTGYQVEVAYDGESALEYAKSGNITLMILDWMIRKQKTKKRYRMKMMN